MSWILSHLGILLSNLNYDKYFLHIRDGQSPTTHMYILVYTNELLHNSHIWVAHCANCGAHLQCTSINNTAAKLMKKQGRYPVQT